MLVGKPLEHVRPERPRRGDRDARHRGLRQDEARAQLPERLAARVRVGAIDDERAVQVVELVLDDPRVGTLQLEGRRIRPSRPSPPP